jgi:hypothetical protein
MSTKVGILSFFVSAYRVLPGGVLGCVAETVKDL